MQYKQQELDKVVNSLASVLEWGTNQVTTKGGIVRPENTREEIP